MVGIMKLAISLLLLFAAPFSAHTHEQTILQPQHVVEKKIAIIGGGAAGTSAAFWISNVFGNRINVSTTLYERSNYLGGRSTIVPIKDDPQYGYMELGASIFVPVNYNLMNATKKFNLSLTTLVDKNISERIGVWDGAQFLFQETSSGWFDKIRAVWRYGLTPLKIKNLVSAITARWLKVYDDSPAFINMDHLVKYLGLQREIEMTAADYYAAEKGLNERYLREIVQSATRVNYGQDLDELHALGSHISMAAAGAHSVKGGNFQIFEEFALRSKADIRLNTVVKDIQTSLELDDNCDAVTRYILQTSTGSMESFDAVIIAAPLQSTNLKSFRRPEYPKYKKIHVTLVAGRPNPTKFGKTISNVPTTIVTTGSPYLEHFENGTQPFTTFAQHKFVWQTKETVVKMFSAKQIEEEQLDQLFFARSWTYRKTWDAYPVLHTVKPAHWMPIVLDGNTENGIDTSGIFYVNSFESLFSTMESQTVASKNIVRLLHQEWCAKEGYCPEFGDGWGQH
ncbi:Prenylcysteine lyase-domain-containing protein [Umbelopsis sp. PMI_123]|nr:Prenylcysteine lyase-domain-containing protein [Umbelopsis sp. PMI_123]